jgi:catalase
MASSRAEGSRKTKPGDAVANRQKQLEAFTQSPENLLTTSQGVVLPDNHNSLKAGARGPGLLQDFLLREKLAHFSHERIPERVIYARGRRGHGYFELTRPLVEYTRADFLQEVGSRTPVFVRFSNFIGAQGSADTVRDVRGFAVKFYTREGNYDLVGSSMPVFFIQDAMKLPDLVHAMKPEPHHGMPQASSAHDTFWDFVSLMPESSHMLLWLMSDRALPRSYRMMDGFGVHTFRLVNARGVSHFVKFHWRPKLGRHALAREEAQTIAGRDPDFHRRDLWEAIEKGDFPEWELALQIIDEDRAAKLGFDLLDATKLLPEEVVPLLTVGRLVLNRNPENFFARPNRWPSIPATWCPASTSATIRCCRAGLAAYTDAHMARLGGPNHAELPDQPRRLPGAQLPARRPPAHRHPARPRGLRAEHAGQRLRVPGRRRRTGLPDAWKRTWSRPSSGGAAPPSTITSPRPRCSGTARAAARRSTSSRPSSTSCRASRRRRSASASWTTSRTWTCGWRARSPNPWASVRRIRARPPARRGFASRAASRRWKARLAQHGRQRHHHRHAPGGDRHGAGRGARRLQGDPAGAAGRRRRHQGGRRAPGRRRLLLRTAGAGGPHLPGHAVGDVRRRAGPGRRGERAGVAGRRWRHPLRAGGVQALQAPVPDRRVRGNCCSARAWRRARRRRMAW